MKALKFVSFALLLTLTMAIPQSSGVVGDLAFFQTAAVLHAARLKQLAADGKALRAYWDKLALPGSETAVSPLSNTDLTNYATLLSAIQDFLDNVQVSAGDRRAIVERVASKPVTNGY